MSNNNNGNSVKAQAQSGLEVLVGGVAIGNAQIVNDHATGNLRDIVAGLGGTVEWIPDEKGKGVAIVTLIDRATQKPIQIKYDTRTMKDSFGNSFSISSDGRIQAGVRQIAETAKVDDTISYYHDENGKFKVIVQPEMKYGAVQVVREENNIKIKAYVNYTGDANMEFPNSGGFTYADIATAGITNKWSGGFQGTEFDFNPSSSINVQTQVIRSDSAMIVSKNQKFMNVEIKKNDKPIGILGQLVGKENISHYGGITAGDLWPISKTGRITLHSAYNGSVEGKYVYNSYSANDFQLVAAHEFGHALGLDDAYPGSKRPPALVTSEVPDFTDAIGPDIMRSVSSNARVTANDIEMVWHAWETNKWQYFADYSGHKKSPVIKLP